MAHHQDDIRKLAELMKDVRICMLVTEDAEGHLRSRPMAMQQVEFDGNLWFFTGKSTEKTSEVEHNKNVNISFSKPEDNRYISVSGIAECVDDRAKARELWNPLYKTWFPEGLDDPDLTLMKVRVQRAEYWDSPNGVVTYLLGYVKAVTTGKRPGELGDHEKIELSR